MKQFVLPAPPASLKQSAVRALEACLPGTAEMLRVIRRRQGVEFTQRCYGLDRLNAAFLARNPAVVKSGPFAGMRYVRHAVGSVLIPKLLGCYESELHPWIERTFTRPYDSIIDVGCAEGYYAVGLARGVPGSTVYAYDIDPLARRLTHRLARMNGVADRIVIGGKLDESGLRSALVGHALVMCDCEGFEYQLLDPARIPALQDAEMLIELHPWAYPDGSAEFLRRFDATHSIEWVTSMKRDPRDHPSLDFFSRAERERALDELHCVMDWVFLTPR